MSEGVGWDDEHILDLFIHNSNAKYVHKHVGDISPFKMLCVDIP